MRTVAVAFQVVAGLLLCVVPSRAAAGTASIAGRQAGEASADTVVMDTVVADTVVADTVVADTVPVVMSVSGAVSVGAYQAGVNWTILQFLRRLKSDPDFRHGHGLPVHELRAVTGASAGNVNTLLWAVEWCTRPPAGPPDAESSLFWQVWVGLGLNSMLRPGQYDRRTMDRAVLDRSELRRITDPPIFARLRSAELEPGCEMPLGITLTRIRPGVIRLEELEIETQRFATIFRAVVVDEVEEDGDRLHFLQLETRPEEEPHFGKLLRLLPHQGRISTQGVLRTAEASAAFPVALAPVRLGVWYPDDGGYETNSVFIDGGVFDNNPVNLALGIYRHVRDASEEGRAARVLYVNPFRYRGDLARQRAWSDARPESVGGVSVLGDFLGGFVPTARQYELQLLARERSLRDEADERLRAHMRAVEDRLRLFGAGVAGTGPAEAKWLAEAQRDLAAYQDSVAGGLARQRDPLFFSTRMYPIYGEHLGAFAGFLGRPMQEFDFYVGVYDGVHFVASEFLCGSETASRRDACVRREMAALILDPQFTPEVARRLLAVLHDREHYPDRLPSDRPALARSVAPAEPQHQATDRVLLALFRAASTQLAEDRKADCSRMRDMLARFLCEDGLTPMLERFRDDTVRWTFGSGAVVANGAPVPPRSGTDGDSILAILRDWERSCEPDRPGECRVDADFIRLVENPRHQATVFTERLLHRMEAVERGLKADDLPHFAGTVAAANALFHTTHLRSRGRVEFSPSLPTGAGVFWNVLPYSVGGAVGRAGWEVRWRPALNLGHRFAITMPVTWHDQLDVGQAGEPRAYWGVGAGVAFRGPRMYTGVFWPEVGLETHAFRIGAGDCGVAGCPQSTATELYGTFVAGFLRLALRMDHQELYARTHRWSFTVALADIAGLAYWIRRVSCSEDGWLGCPR
jgi:hypothetical protein